jgi:hypothetical protein
MDEPRGGRDVMVAVARELNVVSGWVFDSYLLGGLVWFGMLLPFLCAAYVPISLAGWLVGAGEGKKRGLGQREALTRCSLFLGGLTRFTSGRRT